MFAFLLRVDGEDALRRVSELGTVVYRSRVSNVVGVEARTDIAKDLEEILGVSSVMRDAQDGTLC